MRLIDADELMKHRRRAVMFYWSGEAQEDVVTVSEINNAPTIDPASLVKRGRWKDGGNAIYDVCTACNEEIYLAAPMNYCPNCGALIED